MLAKRSKLDTTKTGTGAQNLDAGLKKLVIGQDDAIAQIVNMYQMYTAGMAAPGRPIGSFLFLGPTGSGKTRVVEATAETLFKNPRAVIKIDCAEFQHSHEIAKLIGSPPGYLGHRETKPLLSQEVLSQHHTDTVKISLVLFDEIEKASDSLWNLLLGILDKATLTLGDNRRVDFSQAMIFLTSNLGATKMVGKPPMGFAAAFAQELTEHKTKQQLNRLGKIGLEAAKSRFTPEFINRLDKIVSFNPLSEAAVRQILEVELSAVQQRCYNASNQRPFVISCDLSAKALIQSKGYDIQYGARHLKRAIEKLLVQPLCNLMASDQISGGDVIVATCPVGAEELDFYRDQQGLSLYEMSQFADTAARGIASAKK